MVGFEDGGDGGIGSVDEGGCLTVLAHVRRGTVVDCVVGHDLIIVCR